MIRVVGLNRNLAAVRRAENGIVLNPEVLAESDIHQYFDEVLCGSDMGEYSLNSNTVYFYCPIAVAYRTVQICDLSLEVAHRRVISGPFFRSATRWDSRPQAPKYTATEIRLQGRYFGHYLPEINALLLCVGHLGVRTHGRPLVESWNALWELLKTELDIKKISAEKVRVIPRKLPKIELTLGADPEFEALDSTGSLVNAGVFMSGERLRSEVGRDGAGSQVELRPPPAKTPAELVRNLRGVFKKFNYRYEDYHLSVRGNVYPLGGHIHAGIGMPFVPSELMVQALDDFIGRPTIDLSGRARQYYKRLGQVREQPHGFEYRSTPAALFVRPNILRITMKIFYNLMDKYLNTKGFIYSSPTPTKEDYMVVAGITESEYNRFKDFCTTYHEKARQRGYLLATAFWAGKKPPSKKKARSATARIAFQDVWAVPAIRNDFRREVVDIVKQYGEGTYDVLFYGYSVERGFTSNIDVYSWSYRSNELDLGGPVLRIGLPYLFRNDEAAYKSDKDNVLRAVARVLERQTLAVLEEGEF